MSLEELRAAVLALPVEDRRKLADDLRESIEHADADAPPPQWMIDELERREAYARANPGSWQTWDQVLDYIRTVMAASFALTLQAREDVAAAHDWYEADRPGRGARFLTRVQECITTVCRVPKGGSPLTQSYRKAVVQKFPYIVV